MNQGKKLGRPTNAPKDTTIRLRIDKETLKRLDLYAEAQGLNRSEAIRKLINEA
ncbi:ribbon-helix-helix protein, CopG family [Colibacter massiliensis]|uniref:ribbon-helix-helix protein, CopG family n=1 Tax=Colibacter massiliensis TaxID=1852379 RepID=UPI003F90E530